MITQLPTQNGRTRLRREMRNLSREGKLELLMSLMPYIATYLFYEYKDDPDQLMDDCLKYAEARNLDFAEMDKYIDAALQHDEMRAKAKERLDVMGLTGR